MAAIEYLQNALISVKNHFDIDTPVPQEIEKGMEEDFERPRSKSVQFTKKGMEKDFKRPRKKSIQFTKKMRGKIDSVKIHSKKPIPVNVLKKPTHIVKNNEKKKRKETTPKREEALPEMKHVHWRQSLLSIIHQLNNTPEFSHLPLIEEEEYTSNSSDDDTNTTDLITELEKQDAAKRNADFKIPEMNTIKKMILEKKKKKKKIDIDLENHQLNIMKKGISKKKKQREFKIEKEIDIDLESPHLNIMKKVISKKKKQRKLENEEEIDIDLESPQLNIMKKLISKRKKQTELKKGKKKDVKCDESSETEERDIDHEMQKKLEEFMAIFMIICIGLLFLIIHLIGLESKIYELLTNPKRSTCIIQYLFRTPA